MAVIKCKMCGGDLELVEGASVATCEYCGTTQTVPTADSEKKMTLFGRANRLLRACEFDKAAGVYESIVADFPEEAEAYWGLVLCKYGIEYVDDPATAKKIPTCHRSSFDSVLDDDNFEQAQENADAVARKVYREEAKTIEELRRGIIEVSGKEAPYDIFICYKETAENGDRTLDSVLAQDIYDALTEKGYRVFFSRVTLEDKLGQEYEPYIFAALNSAKIMLAVGTDYEYYNAVWVKNEWSRFLQLIAAGQKKVLIPCFKNLDPYDMPKEFAKLQSQDLGKVGAMQDLLRGIEKIIPKNAPQAARPEAVQQSGPNVASLIERGNIELEDSNWDKATELFDQALSLDPKCGEAYLGLFMSERKLEDWAALKNAYAGAKDRFAGDRRFSRARQYTGAELAKRFEELDAAWEQKRNKEIETFHRAVRRLAPMRDRVKLAEKLLAVDTSYTAGVQLDGTVVAVGSDSWGRCGVGDWSNIVSVSAGAHHTVGLRADGTVVATKFTGDRKYYSGQCDVSEWTDIVAVSAGYEHTIGLRADGTVVATKYSGEYYRSRCNVSDWKNIVVVAAGNTHTVGLQSDGRVVAVGDNSGGQCDVSKWTNIVAIAAGNSHTLGLRADGTVVAAGRNHHGECSVSEWKDIVAVAAGQSHTVGLRSNGTVVATQYFGDNFYYSGQCDVSKWTDIVAVFASGSQTFGLCSDGAVVATKLTGRAMVGGSQTFLRSDGTVMAAKPTGKGGFGQNNVPYLKLFNSIDTLEQDQEAVRRAGERRRVEAVAKRLAERQRLAKERDDLQSELASLHGLFTGKRRKEIESRLAEIERSLK